MFEDYVQPIVDFVRAAPGLGGADRVRARLHGVARVHFAAGAGLGRAGADRHADRGRRPQFLADLGRGLARGGARRLAVLLDRPQARTPRAAHLAAVAASGPDPEGRSLHQEMGRARHLHRALLRAAARLGAAGRRHFRDAVLALSVRELHLGLRLGGGAADASATVSSKLHSA